MLRFEELGFELLTRGLYRLFFRDMEITELSTEELRFRSTRRGGYVCASVFSPS